MRKKKNGTSLPVYRWQRISAERNGLRLCPWHVIIKFRCMNTESMHSKIPQLFDKSNLSSISLLAAFRGVSRPKIRLRPIVMCQYPVGSRIAHLEISPRLYHFGSSDCI